jgi:cobalamin biosynthesis protein CbiG
VRLDLLISPLQGKIPLVVRTNSADIITTVLRLKEELELELNHPLKVTILGGAEAHLLANELAKADVGVVLMPPRPYVSEINLFSIPQ